MRVLLLHNYYGSSAPSGESQVFEEERDLLAGSGHEVMTFVRHSDEIRGQGPWGLLRGAAATPWNPFAGRAVRRAVERFRPEVVHAHNTFPLLSPAVFPAVGARAARVLTLHNYRLFCASAVVLREGRPCTDCLDRRSVLPALRHGCYRGSRLATLPLAAGVALARARRLWSRHVEAFIALTDFQRERMVAAGLPAGRVFVKPNHQPGHPEVVPWGERLPGVTYAGRLSEEKGVGHLVEAWAAWGPGAPPLRIAGDGPLRERLEARARAAGLSQVSFLGRLAPEAARAEIARARLLVIPSIWFEGFPLVLREALAAGTPVAASALGPLPGLLQQGRAGLLFRAADPAALLEAVRGGLGDDAGLARRGAEARRAYEASCAPGPNLEALLGVYRWACAHRAGTVA